MSNFKTLISYCKSYGGDYKPSKQELKISELETLHQNAKTVVDEVSETSTTVKTATNSRKQIYKPIKPLATRAINALKSSGAEKEIVADARTVVRKLFGKRAGDIKPPKEGEESNNHSVSQQSFAYQLEHFKAFRNILQAESLYAPAEEDIQVATFSQKVTALEDVNDVLRDSDVIWTNKRNSRKSILYHEKTGLVAIALSVKS